MHVYAPLSGEMAIYTSKIHCWVCWHQRLFRSVYISVVAVCQRHFDYNEHLLLDFTELTTPMIHEFVDKIMVHEADKSTGDRIQQLDIYLKYVGKLDIPMLKLTPEQIKEEERKRRKRAWNRTYMRRR